MNATILPEHVRQGALPGNDACAAGLAGRDHRRRNAIAAAVATHNSAHPEAPLPRNAARLLAAMFPAEDVCQRSLDDLAAEGLDRRTVSRLLGALVEAGLLSKEQGPDRAPNTYWLHLPSVRP